MAPTDVLPVRYCHGCKQYDDHPRVTNVTDINNPATDQLFHYDCTPDHMQAAHPEIAPGLAATAQGKRSQEVREVMAAHGAAIAEAPATTIQGA